MKKDRFVPDFLEHIDTRGDPILPSRVVVGGQLVLRAGQSAKRLFSLLIPQVSDAQQGRQRQPSASRLAQSMIIVHVPRCQTAGAHSIFEIACLERTDLKPETLGLTLAEGKRILKDLQQIVVESQVASFPLPARACPGWGRPPCSKGANTPWVRTGLGQRTVRNEPRDPLAIGPPDPQTVSPKAQLVQKGKAHR